jgi:hypothetical protein
MTINKKPPLLGQRPRRGGFLFKPISAPKEQKEPKKRGGLARSISVKAILKLG